MKQEKEILQNAQHDSVRGYPHSGCSQTEVPGLRSLSNPGRHQRGVPLAVSCRSPILEHLQRWSHADRNSRTLHTRPLQLHWGHFTLYLTQYGNFNPCYGRLISCPLYDKGHEMDERGCAMFFCHHRLNCTFPVLVPSGLHRTRKQDFCAWSLEP